MTLEEAIEDLTKLEKYCQRVNWLTHDKAVKLGIESLFRIKGGRRRGYDYFGHLLPGETKD